MTFFTMYGIINGLLLFCCDQLREASEMKESFQCLKHQGSLSSFHSIFLP